MNLSDFTAHVSYCEDVRQEASGAQTYVGVMRGDVGIPEFPGFMGKLAIVVDLIGDGRKPWLPTSVSVIKAVDGQPDQVLASAMFDQAAPDPVPSPDGHDFVVLSAVIALQPLPVEGPMRIRVSIERGGTHYPVPGLGFIQAQAQP